MDGNILVLAPLCNFPLLITEEKERGTLPLLFRSKVTEAQFTASKAVSSLLTGELMAVIVFFISGASPSLLPQYLLINLIAIASLSFGSIAMFIPTSFMGIVLNKVHPVEGFLDISLPLSFAVCLIWFAAGLAVLYAVRKKRAFFTFCDNK